METSSTDNRHTREAISVVDYPANLQQIAEYISLADQPPRQVLIEAHILQIDLSDDCRSGINLEALTSSAAGYEFNLQTSGFATGDSDKGPGFFLKTTDATSEIENLVELLQTTTDAKTLASPKVLVVSGQQARMQVGEKLGFKVTTTTQTSTLEEIQFLDVGVVLTVTPRVTRDGRVLMRIKPEVSTGLVVDGIPNSDTTEVETDIMLSDGQGMVIGGLIQEKDSNIQSKVPWLGDLPYVGILFQKRQILKTRSEIIVTLVPHIQPYTPIVAARENHELMRSLEPLTVGPLDRFYRPYEAQLPDTFLNPRRPLMGLLEPLPPVEHVGGRGIAEDGRRKPVFPSPPISDNSKLETRN
jgi:type II secretory pathway component GspD/PulD (secretin)